MEHLHKIGIIGGTFDPIHIGHLIIAESALSELELDKVIFMPSGNPPHKSIKRITDFRTRSDMVKLSIDNNENFVYSNFEIQRDGYIYTSDTLRLLKEQQPDWDLHFIIGADSLFYLEQWHEPEKIFQRCRIVVADRDNSDEKIKSVVEHLNMKYNTNIYYINSPLVNISSSLIRERVYNRKSIKYLVTPDVENYITSNKLYMV